MIVITLTDCPPALRGDLTKWLQEIDTGVYVGQVSARVRDEIWTRVRDSAKSGRATMVYSANNEQHMNFRVHNSDWEPVDFDGLKLMLRPSTARIKKLSETRMGFSNAYNNHMAKKMSGLKRNTNPLPEEYAVIDVETTGLSVKEHEIIEIAAIKVSDKNITARFRALVKPVGRVPPQIEALTGITCDMLQHEGRELPDVLKDFLSFVGDLYVVSHNADFDLGFLRTACERCNLPRFINKSIDTLTLSRRLVDDTDNYKLSTLLKHFGIEMGDAHRGENDCMATKELYEKLNEIKFLNN